MDEGSPSAAFLGVDVGSKTTLFFRQSPEGIEGFVVDSDRLIQTVKQRVLDERGLSEVVEVTALSDTELRYAGRREGHQHKFAEPFESVSATLRLAPLEAPLSEQLLLPITALIGFFIVVGLWALYRMVATQIAFAKRQGNFVAAVSHELKTPLTAIRMHGEMLQDGLVESPEKAQEYYRTITSQAERLSRLIGNVLLLSSIEKSAPTEPKRGDVLSVIRATATTLLPHIEKSGFSLGLEVPDTAPLVLRDPDSVEQILFNLVDNSLKYASKAEDKRLTISVEVTSTSVVLSVRDRGPGVPQSDRERIFEAFFRLEDEMTRRSQGTGLGLALVSDLAARMGATVSAKNAHPGLLVTVEFRR